MAERDAAPAGVTRTHTSGTPRVTVRPNYGGAAHQELDAGRTNEGESLRDQGEDAKRSPCVQGPSATACVALRELAVAAQHLAAAFADSIAH